MEDSFNPYAEWLGIAVRGGRPNHYALLGLALFESDTSEILIAFERRTSALTRVAGGPREILRQRLLRELTQAKETLADAAQKKRYDELLRRKVAPRTAAPPGPATTATGNVPRQAQSRDRVSSADLLPPRAVPAASSLPTGTGDPMAPIRPIGATGDRVAPLVSSVVNSEQTPAAVDNRVAGISDQLASARMAARKLAGRRQKAPYWVLASMLVLLVVVAAALAVGYASGLIHIGPLRAVVERDADGPDLPPLEPAADDARVEGITKVTVTPRAEDTPERSLPALKDPTPETNQSAKTDTELTSERTATKPADPPVDPAQAARFKAELVAARKALGERNAQAAKERVAAAEKLAVSVEQKYLVAGFQALPKYVDGFWDAVREGIKGLEDAGELKIGNTIVSVVEVTTERLTIRANGQNRRYPLDELPAGIAVAIASKWFDNRPDNKVYLGAFYFVDPRTDVAEAKRLWEEAMGAGVDVKQLLALLPIAEK